MAVEACRRYSKNLDPIRSNTSRPTSAESTRTTSVVGIDDELLGFFSAGKALRMVSEFEHCPRATYADPGGIRPFTISTITLLSQRGTVGAVASK
jgi:hypothetical protein